MNNNVLKISKIETSSLIDKQPLIEPVIIIRVITVASVFILFDPVTFSNINNWDEQTLNCDVCFADIWTGFLLKRL